MSGRAPCLVVLTGPIASGKSTIGRRAVAGTTLSFFPEDVDSRPEDREVLAGYYRAVEQYESLENDRSPEALHRISAAREAVLQTQVHFIRRRSNLLRGALREGQGGIAERHPTDDIEVFSRRNLQKGLLTPEQFAGLEKLMARELEGIPLPKLHVFLHAAPSRLRERIRRRGREQEADLLREENPYLEELNRLYEEWFARLATDKVLVQTDELSEEAIAERVRGELTTRDLL